MAINEGISINNFGPLCDIEIKAMKDYTFFIGISGSGKSTLLKTIAFMRWVYKMMCIRSYLHYSGIKSSTFKINFLSHLKSMGMDKFLRQDTVIRYHCGSFSVVYDKKMRFPKKYVDKKELSLEKISFIADKRCLIGDILENNVSLKKRAFYINETFEDYLAAADALHHYEMKSLGVRLQVKKTNTGVKHVIEPINGDRYSISLNESSSGTQSSIPLCLIVDYFSNHFDIVASLNDAVFRYVSKSDSLKDFKAESNVGELPNKRVSLFVEEPEMSLFPATQRQLIDEIISDIRHTRGYSIGLMVATHSPYIINHLNVLLRRTDKDAHVKPTELAVYNVVDGRLQDLIMQDADTGEWVVDTSELSEPMEAIYNEYITLGE